MDILRTLELKSFLKLVARRNLKYELSDSLRMTPSCPHQNGELEQSLILLI